MKLFFLYLAIIMQQGELIDFTKLLGKEASMVEHILLNNEFQPNEHLPRSYLSKESFKTHFGLNCLRIGFTIDEHNLLNSITLTFEEVLNKETFEILNQEFGKPVGIKVIDKEIFLSNNSETEIKDNHTFKKGYATFKEGTFEDDPVFVIWKMKEYEVILHIRHAETYHQGYSMLTYRYPIK